MNNGGAPDVTALYERAWRKICDWIKTHATTTDEVVTEYAARNTLPYNGPRVLVDSARDVAFLHVFDCGHCLILFRDAAYDGYPPEGLYRSLVADTRSRAEALVARNMGGWSRNRYEAAVREFVDEWAGTWKPRVEAEQRRVAWLASFEP